MPCKHIQLIEHQKFHSPLKRLILPKLHSRKIWVPSKIPRVPQQRPNSLSLTPFTNLQETIHNQKINTSIKTRRKKTVWANIPRREENERNHSPIENECRRKTGYCNRERKQHLNEKENTIERTQSNRRFEIVSIGLPRVDSEGCGQWSSENRNELVPLLEVDYSLLFVVEIESGVLGGERSPWSIVFCWRRIGIRFGTLPHVLSALAEVLSLSAGPASSPTTTHCSCLCLLLLHRRLRRSVFSRVLANPAVNSDWALYLNAWPKQA